MRKFGWYALQTATGIFALGSLGLLAANLYVQSHSVQQRIRTALAASLGLPVSLRKTTVTPWDGIRLDGVTIHDDEATGPDGSTDLLTIGSFRVRLAWWPLVAQRRAIVEDVLIERPQLKLSSKRPSLPPQEVASAEPTAPSSAEPADASPPTAVVGAPSPAADAAVPSVEADRSSRRSAGRLLLPLARQLRLRHGEIVAMDHEGRVTARVEGINSNGCVDDPQRAHGSLWFAKACVPAAPGVMLTNYATAVDYATDKGLAIENGRGQLAGGTLTTDCRLQPSEDRWSLAVSGRLGNAALGQLTRTAIDQPPVADGLLNGNVDLRGFLDDPASFSGGGRIWLDGAKLHNFPLVKIIGQVLRIADLSQLEFKQAQMDYRMGDGALLVDGLTLVSNDSQVVLRGRYLIEEDQLDFHGRLTIDRAISHQLPQFIESNFTRCGAEAPDCRYLDFDVTGTRDDPRCNLYDRLMAGPMKGLFDNLLAPKPKNAKAQHPGGGKKPRATAGGATPKP